MSHQEDQIEGEQQHGLALTSIKTVKFSGRPDDYPEWRGKFIALLPAGVAKELIEPKNITSARLQGTLAPQNEILHKRLLLSTGHVAYSIVEATDGDGRQAWLDLQEKYAARSDARIIELFLQLTNMSYDIDTDIDEHLLRAEFIQKQLARLDENVSDLLLRALIIQSLPPEFNTVRAILQSQTTMTKQDFKRHLRVFYDTNFNTNYGHLNGNNDTKCGFRALATRSRGSPADRKPSGKWCSFHKSKFHSDAECNAQQQQQRDASSDGDGDKPPPRPVRACGFRVARTPVQHPPFTLYARNSSESDSVSVGSRRFC